MVKWLNGCCIARLFIFSAVMLPLSVKGKSDNSGHSHISASTNTKETKKFHHDMAYIPAGEFIMGSSDRWNDEKPAHSRYLDSFFIDIYEVTNAEYKKFIDATDRTPPSLWIGRKYPSKLYNHPAVYVTWFDAVDYCKWKKKRLPSEAEWEKAARGTDGRTYPWGNEFDPDKSNNPQKGSTGTEPVGSYENGKSPYGLYDMSGNVWEWVSDWYGPHPGNNEPSEEYGKKYKIIKGGSWYNCLFYGCGISAPTFNRGFFARETNNSSFGFRCVISSSE